MEIPFWSSLYAPKATISPSLVFAAYFSKSRSLMHNQPADFLPIGLFSRPSERVGATSEGTRVGPHWGCPVESSRRDAPYHHLFFSRW